MDTLQLPRTITSIPEGLHTITLGAGCFWCSEAAFTLVKGIKFLPPGYSGGIIENPTDEAVQSGTTGHVEVVQLFYNPSEISLQAILEIFWSIHNPTLLNQQHDDLGPQYRSVIYYEKEYDGDLARKMKQQLHESELFMGKVVTEISPFSNFYAADTKHQNFYTNNLAHPYCHFVIKPILEKLKNLFTHRISVGLLIFGLQKLFAL